MRILFVSSGNNGLDPLLINQANSLIKQGIEIDFYRIKGKGVKGYFSNILPLRKKIKESTFDCIHAHYSLSAFVASLAGASPLIVSLMGSDVKQGKLYVYIIKMFAFIFSWKHIIAKSEDMKKTIGWNDVYVIPNGVDCNRFRPLDQLECLKYLGWNNKKKHILFPSNPARKEKNFDLLIQSIESLRDDFIDIHTVENVPNEDMPIWYNAADVVAMSSLWEGSPNAIKEAMACCRPIVSTNVGDVLWLLEGVDGSYISDFNIKNYSSALYRALLFDKKTNGDKKIEELGLNSHIIAKKIIQLYINCL